VPLHTLRADIDYGFCEARTLLGRIGCKVWIYKGDVFAQVEELEAPAGQPAAAQPAAVAPETPVQEKPTEVAPEAPGEVKSDAATE